MESKDDSDDKPEHVFRRVRKQVRTRAYTRDGKRTFAHVGARSRKQNEIRQRSQQRFGRYLAILLAAAANKLKELDTPRRITRRRLRRRRVGNIPNYKQRY